MPATVSYKVEIASTQAFMVYFFDAKEQVTKHLAGELATQLLSQKNDWLIEVTPAFSSVLISYNLHHADYYRAKSLIKQHCDALLLNESTLINSPESHQQSNLKTAASNHIIDICYDHPDAFDINDIAKHTKLSRETLINLHSQLTLRVDAIGFAPGFAYLTGLPPELQLPRRSTPRLKVPAGAVAIAQQQTAIYPQESPGGWHIIGLSPTTLFDAHTPPYSKFKVGDSVSFNVISLDEYQRQVANNKETPLCN